MSAYGSLSHWRGGAYAGYLNHDGGGGGGGGVAALIPRVNEPNMPIVIALGAITNVERHSDGLRIPGDGNCIVLMSFSLFITVGPTGNLVFISTNPIVEPADRPLIEQSSPFQLVGDTDAITDTTYATKGKLVVQTDGKIAITTDNAAVNNNGGIYSGNVTMTWLSACP